MTCYRVRYIQQCFPFTSHYDVTSKEEARSLAFKRVGKNIYITSIEEVYAPKGSTVYNLLGGYKK